MAAAYSWHSDIKTWKQRNTFLFKNEIMSDCSFIVSNGKYKTIIPAHKYVLGGNSEEFYNLFYLMKSSDEIPIDDVSAENLKKFLEFLYTEKTTLTMDNVGDLLKLAKRYSVTHFEEFCGDFLSENVNKETALSVIDKYSDYEVPNLISKCIKLINQNQLIFESPSFLKVSIQTITEILKSEELEGIKETTIFNGVDKYAEHFCNKNKQMVDSKNKRLAVLPAIPYIRFASMSSQEFTLCTAGNSILSQSESLGIYQSICSGGQIKCNFSDKKRGTQIKKIEFNIRINGTDLFLYKPINDHNHNIFCFTVDNPINFHGFGMRDRNPLEKQNSESFIIQLTDYNEKVLLESEVAIHFDGTNKTFDLLFDNSILLEPDITYAVKFRKVIPVSFHRYYSRATKTIRKEIDGVTFVICCSYFCCQSILFRN